VTFHPLGPYLEASDEVREALAAGRPVVALESTIISHGLPYPANLKTAVAVEEVVRRGGAIPATIAVIRGQARIGCDRDDLERLAAGASGSPTSGSPTPGPPIIKTSVRDLPVLYARGGTGATTVAATATIAAQAGIRVFVTGGIGGVHRGWGETLDISADLDVLGRVSLAVVCSGAKAVLDVAATLEYLETKGVTVVGLGTDRFPGFYLRATPFPVDVVAADPAEAAAIVSARLASGLPGAVLVGVPIPAADELPAAVVETALAAALGEAAARGITGKDVTPFLLEAMRQATGGRSLGANIALVLNNAAVGAAIAVELA